MGLCAVMAYACPKSLALGKAWGVLSLERAALIYVQNNCHALRTMKSYKNKNSFYEVMVFFCGKTKFSFLSWTLTALLDLIGFTSPQRPNHTESQGLKINICTHSNFIAAFFNVSQSGCWIPVFTFVFTRRSRWKDISYAGSAIDIIMSYNFKYTT